MMYVKESSEALQVMDGPLIFLFHRTVSERTRCHTPTLSSTLVMCKATRTLALANYVSGLCALGFG